MISADIIVHEMAQLGAVFTIVDTGGDGLASWNWAPRPESMRTAIRGFWRSVADRPNDASMIAAIRRAGLCDRGGAG